MCEPLKRSIQRSATALVVGIVAVSTAASAANPVAVPTAITPAPGPAELRIENGEIHLTLDEAIELALERNLGVRIQRYSRERSLLDIDRAMGIYDFNLQAGLSTGENETPAASNLDGAEIQETADTNLYVGGSQLLPTGAIASINFPNGEFETNSAFTLLDPSYTSGLDFAFAQPLLRGFGRSATEYGIEVAKVGSEISDQLFEAELVTTVQQVSNAYWLLAAARSRLEVALESLALAKELHENNRVRVEVGTLAPLELVQSEAGIATREEDIIIARGLIGDAEDLLFFFLNVDQGEAWSKSIVPDTAAVVEDFEIDVEDAIRKALNSRPEMTSQQLQVRILELDEAFARQETKPRLDLRAQYGLNGLGGDVLLRDAEGNVIGKSPGGWDDAFEQVTNFDFPGWSVGLELGIPIQNRTARARAAMAGLALEEGKLTTSELELRITTEVRAAVRGVQQSREQLQSAEVSSRLAEKNLDAERKKYANGLSTSFQILEVQEDMTLARERQVGALTGFKRALIEYHRATGSLLESSGITIVN